MPSHHHSSSTSVAKWKQIITIKKVVIEYTSAANYKSSWLLKNEQKVLTKWRYVSSFISYSQDHLTLRFFYYNQDINQTELHKQSYSEKQRNRF